MCSAISEFSTPIDPTRTAFVQQYTTWLNNFLLLHPKQKKIEIPFLLSFNFLVQIVNILPAERPRLKRSSTKARKQERKSLWSKQTKERWIVLDVEWEKRTANQNPRLSVDKHQKLLVEWLKATWSVCVCAHAFV